MGPPCMLVRREAAEPGRDAGRGVLHVQRGDRLVLPLPRGRLEGLFLPGRRGRGIGRRCPAWKREYDPMYREQLRGHLRFFAKHYGPRRAEQARRLLLAVDAAPLGGLPWRAQAHLPGGRRLARVRRRGHSPLGEIEQHPASICRLLAATAVVLAPGLRARARARSARDVGDARVVAHGPLRRARGDVPRRGRRSRSPSCCSRLATLGLGRRQGLPGPAGAEGRRALGLARRPGRRGRRHPALQRHGHGAGRRALPPRARAQARGARRALARGGRRVRGREPPPRLRVPALARAARAHRADQRHRLRAGRPPPAFDPRPDRRARRVRGGVGALPHGVGRRRGGRSLGRDRLLRARERRRLPDARAPRERVEAPALRGCSRARADRHADAFPGRLCVRSPPGSSLPWSTRPTRSSSGSRSRASCSCAGSGRGRTSVPELAVLCCARGAGLAVHALARPDRGGHGLGRRRTPRRCSARSSSTRDSSTCAR